ncbi:hypothetical protein B0T25DRAFT_554363 [Lasiosphaeria hispida]|uniref:Uncharacterized protein n=1 Tax=Lasiosphaeria hispida TaxID=260671 RepID=A0AAJ0M8Z1_9PEZI|nr:hypothetical protein B0T25DRAFT_554363 [Lasiosphaeria hispida]
MRFLFVVLLLNPHLSIADSTSDATTASSELVGYVQDPNGRGTLSLLISCVLTLILCVWSALHLNVPSRNHTAAGNAWLNTRWIVTGIYAPELVVFAAWRQWCSAKLLQKLVANTLNNASPKPSSNSDTSVSAKPHEWTMTHSFFACTGGFAFEFEGLDAVDAADKDQEKRQAQRITLTARGVALLAQCGRLPKVDREDIEDKSKANDLAKATVIVQACWMLVQIISRLAAKLPVTLLEVNTVAHVLCAFAMYLFWWNKPLLPNQPIIIRDKELKPLAAFMYASSEMSGYVNPKRIKSETLVKTVFAHLSLFSKVPELETICFRTTASSPTSENSKPLTSSFEVSPLASVGRSPQSCMDLLQSQREKESGTAFFERRPRVVDKRPTSDFVSAGDQNRWSLIKTAFAGYPFLNKDRLALAHDIGDAHCLHLKPEQLVADHIKNWPSNDLLRNVDGLIVGMVLWLANFCYGGIHAAAWNDHFPSVPEKWLWRASASYIGFCGGLWVILNLLVAKYRRLNDFWERWMDGEKSWWQNFGIGVLVFICGFSLMLARFYIVLEAFMSIREMPVSSYQTPEWTDVFPHF